MELALEQYILKTAPDWRADIDAPNTWEDLKKFKNVPVMYVSPVGCDYTIFSHPNINMAMRAIHDRIHLDYNLSFSVADEMEVAFITCCKFSKEGYSKYRDILWLDTVGQALYYDKYKEYVFHQRLFILQLLLKGCKYGDISKLKEVI